MDDQQILDQIVVASRELYSLPAVAMRVLDLTGRPDVDSAQLKSCIEQDPALTAKVLRTVNSSLFGLSNPVADLAQAVTMLGIQPLKLLVLGFSLPEGLLQNQSAHVLSWYWRRTLTKAVAARAVCERLKHAPGDEAFVVGMLADIGLLAFAQAFGEPYAKFLERVSRRADSLIAAERHALGFDHRQYTLRLVEAWRLPTRITEAIASTIVESDDDLEPECAKLLPLGQALRQADLLVELLCDQRSGVLGELIASAGGGIDEAQVEPLVLELSEQVHQLAEVMNVTLGSTQDYVEVMIEAHRQLSIAASEAAIDIARRNRHKVHVSNAEEVDELRAARNEWRLPAIAASLTHAAHPAWGDRHLPKLASARTSSSNDSTAAAVATATVDSPSDGLKILREQLGFAAQACRRSRVPISLLVMSSAEGLPSRATTPTAFPHRADLSSYLELIDHREKLVVPLNTQNWAVVFLNCDRRQVADQAHALMTVVTQDLHGKKACAIGLGAATASLPARNFDVDRMIEAAERCCLASRMAGGNVLKSIEIF